MIKRKMFLCSLVFMSLTFAGCSTQTAKPVEKTSYAMGTIITQKVYGDKAEVAVDEADNEIKSIEKLVTINAPGGDINNVNSNSGKQWTNVSPITMYLLEKSKEFSNLSEGAFDISVAPIVKLWGIGTDKARIPSDIEIKAKLPLIDYKKIQLKSKSKNVFLATKGQMVDLGGIAKGYAGDVFKVIYKKHGITSALTNLGGNVVVVGNRPDGKPWVVGIQNPRSTTGSYVATVKVKDKAVVSSGDYERYFEKNGVRYHHIIDPKTGKPSRSGVIGVTIIADSSIDADALSTSAFVLGIDKGMKLIEKYGKVEAIFITSDKKIYITDGLKGNFSFTDESGEYTYVEKR